MRIEFWLRTPGNHAKIAETTADCVPSTGDSVFVGAGEDERSLTVHEVYWFFPKSGAGNGEYNWVKVLLK